MTLNYIALATKVLVQIQYGLASFEKEVLSQVLKKKKDTGSFNIWSKSKYICRVILILYFKMYYFDKLPNCETRLWNVKKTEVEVLKVALLPWRYQVGRADKVLVKAGKSLVVAVGQHYLDNIGCGSAQMVFTSLTTPLFEQHWPLSRQPKA